MAHIVCPRIPNYHLQCYMGSAFDCKKRSYIIALYMYHMGFKEKVPQKSQMTRK